MMKKGIVFGALLLLSTISHAGMTICNKFSCQPAKQYDSVEILNVIGQVLSGGQKELVFCEAEQRRKVCTKKPITFSAQTNLMSVQFQIPFVRIMQVYSENEMLHALMDYQVQANQYYPLCKPVDSIFSTSGSFQKDYFLTSSNFDCQITELGETKMELHFMIDYMDLDQNYIGAFYKSSVTGDVSGEGEGYVLMKISEQREIELPRPQPSPSVSDDRYNLKENYFKVPQPILHLEEQETPLQSESKINNEVSFSEKWNNFKEKFLKILYLEPLDD